MPLVYARSWCGWDATVNARCCEAGAGDSAASRYASTATTIHPKLYKASTVYAAARPATCFATCCEDGANCFC